MYFGLKLLLLLKMILYELFKDMIIKGSVGAWYGTLVSHSNR